MTRRRGLDMPPTEADQVLFLLCALSSMDVPHDPLKRLLPHVTCRLCGADHSALDEAGWSRLFYGYWSRRFVRRQEPST